MAIRFFAPWWTDQKKPRRYPLFEGGTKNIFPGEDGSTHILQFKDQIEAPDQRIHPFPGKGGMANRFSEAFMSRLEELQIPTHFIKRLNMTEQLVTALEMLPFRVVVYNKVIGNLSTRLGIPPLTELERPIIEFHLKNREAHESIITAMHVDALNWCAQHEIDYLYFIAGRINDNFMGQCQALGLNLLRFSVDFGRFYPEEEKNEALLFVADQLAPENFLVQDKNIHHLFPCFEETANGPMLHMENYREVTHRFGLLPAIKESAGFSLPSTAVYFADYKEKK